MHKAIKVEPDSKRENDNLRNIDGNVIYDNKAKNKDKCHTNMCDYDNKKFR